MQRTGNEEARRRCKYLAGVRKECLGVRLWVLTWLAFLDIVVACEDILEVGH